jgi:hypothetical protein
MSKFDLVAAYKQVPCRIEDLRLQGFMFFGASISVCNFDILGETVKTTVLAE